MNATEFQKLLHKLGACTEAVHWASGKSLREVWQQCDRADWLLWLCARMVGQPGWPTREGIVLVECDIVETSLPFFEKKHPNDKRPHQAIEAARVWANCDPKDKNKNSLAAARAYADAAAAVAVADADCSTVWSAKMKEFADVVRKRLKIPADEPPKK